MTTPSGFHDEAYRRKASHDQIQAEVLDMLRRRPLACLPMSGAVHREVEGEYALIRGGQVIAFVDAIEIVTMGLDRHVFAFEVKPEVYTVGGIVRQLKATEVLIQTILRPKHLIVSAVVPWTDSNLSALRREWPSTWAWGIRFDAVADE